MIEHEKALKYFQNLYLLAIIDKKLAKEEINYLVQIAQQMGISVRESTDIMMHSQTLELQIPETEEERINQLEDIISLMMIDKKIHEKEYELCYHFAQTLGLDKKSFDLLILKIVTNR
ncbi:MAG: hypothetical protein MUE85_12335 [Microscillaceae bacterium]|jgi:uncharacterized tellurite resistance protein B-like protein|nr:hypothetical protein [Microscillaceae bacterium]